MMSEAGFRLMFEQQFPYVMRALRNLGVQPRDLEDCAHDLFIAVHKSRDSYAPDRPIKPWLFAFAYGIASNYRRLARHRHEVVDTAPDDPPAPDWVQRSDAKAMIAAALEQMDVDRCAVLVMHEIEGHTTEEIAQALGIPLGTVYSRLRLARDDLRRSIAPSPSASGGAT